MPCPFGFSIRRFALLAHRLRAAVGCALSAAVLAWGSSAHAEATVSKLNLVLSANPSTVSAKDFNDGVIGHLNSTVLQPRGLEGLDKITFAWLFDAQLRYFVRPNFAVEVGAGQLKTSSSQEYLPSISAAVQYRAELLSVPVHIGGAYYLPAYNQGDFQARAYVGGGMTSLVFNRERFQAVEANTDSTNTLGGTYKITGRGDSPGYYLETGVHMFFAVRYSVMIGALYRSAKVRTMEGLREEDTPDGVRRTDLGPIISLDTSGIGARFALAIGF
jgi:hypothetical protein